MSFRQVTDAWYNSNLQTQLSSTPRTAKRIRRSKYQQSLPSNRTKALNRGAEINSGLFGQVNRDDNSTFTCNFSNMELT